MNFNNMRVSTRLSAAFGLLVVILLAVAGVAWMQMVTMRASSNDVATNWLPSVQHINQMQSQLNAYRTEEMRHVLSTDDAAMKAVEEALDRTTRRIDAEDSVYAKLISSKEEQALYDEFAAARKLYAKEHARMIELSRKNENAQAREVAEGASKRAFESMSVALQKLVDMNTRGAAAAAADSEAAFVSAGKVLLGAALAALVLAVAAAWSIIRSITVPLRQAVAVTHRVAEGDLTTQVDVNRSDELGQLLAALKRMQDSLVRTVGTVRGNADSVATASAQIAQGNLDLSQRTEKQASALQETAASMEQLGSTVKLNADNAQRANSLSQDAATIATRGGSVVQQVVERMKEINDSSRRIENITGVIDGIAFQTNILALNAAVEAARAGEQGRGFAVVASEVRTLAQRSAEAAREIKGLIASSVQQVQQGSGLVAEAGQTMDEIVNAIQKVNALVGEISSASVEQSTGVSQVGEAVSQMDQTTQQNAALVEESAAAADSLRRQASELVSAVASFRLQAQAANADSVAHLSVVAAPAARAQDKAADKPADQPAVKAADKPARPIAKPAPAASQAAESRRIVSPQKPGTATGTDDWESF